ncbi:hypothetical protein JXQ70_06545 [bacterium]|nr:hypothetical protein [bacterium]
MDRYRVSIRVQVFIILIIGLVMLCADLGQAAWVKQGKFEGLITDVHTTSARHFVATAGAGVYRSTTGYTWVQINDGLESLDVVAITTNPSNPAVVFCATQTTVYYSTDAGSSWSAYATQTPEHPRISCLAFVAGCGLYVGTYGSGLWNWDGAIWSQCSLPLPNLRVLSMASYDDHLIIGTEYDSLDATNHPGGLYFCDNCVQDTWTTVSGTTTISWPSLAGHAIGSTGFAMVLAGSAFNGIWYSLDSGASFSEYCPFFRPALAIFKAIDFACGSLSGEFAGLAGTGHYLWCLHDDPRGTCTDGYSAIDGFIANISAIGVINSYSVLVGVKGKGLYKDDFALNGICEIPTNISENYITHKNVNEIAVSPNLNSDNTIFIASKSEGIYKSRTEDPLGNREFTRYFCEPGGFAPTDILSIALVPGYNDDGNAWSSDFTNEKVILLGSNGSGVFLSYNGGASWYEANGGTMTSDAVITDVTYVPSAPSNPYALAARWGSGLYISGNMGQGWSMLDIYGTECYSDLHEINEIAVPDDFPANMTIFLATNDGLVRVFYNTVYSHWDCEVLHSIPVTQLELRYNTMKSTIYYGSPGYGIWRGTLIEPDSMWDTVQLYDGNLGPNAKIIDLTASQGFYGPDLFYVLYAVVHNSGGDQLFTTNDYPDFTFPGWIPVITPMGGTGDRLRSVSFGPDFDPFNYGPINNIYLGHAFQGLSYAEHDTISGPSSWIWASGFYAFPHEVTASASDPLMPNLVFFATKDLGMFVSYDGGESACPWGNYLDYYDGLVYRSTTDITSIAVTNNYSFLFHDDFTDDFSTMGWTVSGGTESWFRQIDGTQGYDGYLCPPTFNSSLPFAQVDSDCAGYVAMDEQLISPVIDTSTSSRVFLEFDHYFRYYSGNDPSGYAEFGDVDVSSTLTGGIWTNVARWDETTGSSSNPEFTRINITRYAAEISDLQFRFHYYNVYYDWYWYVDNVKLFDLDDTERKVIIGTNNHGIYTNSYTSIFNVGYNTWNWATSDDGNALRESSVPEVVYYGPGEDLWAAVTNNLTIAPPAYRSVYNPLLPGNLGDNWEMVYGGLSSSGFTGIDYGLPEQGKNMLKDPKGIVQEMWCCSGGSRSPYKLGDLEESKAPKLDYAGAYHYDGSLYNLSNGTAPYNLSGYVYYNSIMNTSAGRLYIGGWTEETGYTQFSGVWISDDEGETWFQANSGLETLDSQQISCFLELDDGRILLGVKDNTEGGVYLSENGLAWIRVDDFSGDRGVNELSTDGSSIYADMVSDGTKKETALSISGSADPVPEFLYNNDLRTLADHVYPEDTDYDKWVWVNVNDTIATFNNMSTGLANITGYEWDFSYDGSTFSVESTDENPLHPYTRADCGIQTVAFRLNGSIIKTHKIYVYESAPPPFPDGKYDGDAMTVVKTGSKADGDSLLITWDASCAPIQANILYGNLGDITSYVLQPSGTNECDIITSGNTNYTWNIGSTTNIWFILVSDNTGTIEGSWGYSDIGTEDFRNGGIASGQCGCDDRSNAGACAY